MKKKRTARAPGAKATGAKAKATGAKAKATGAKAKATGAKARRLAAANRGRVSRAPVARQGKVRRRVPARARPKESTFPVVGIGASAGGLEALGEFFSGVPRDTGAAFVVVTHQHPGHVSLLPELLSKRSTLPVISLEGRIRIEPDHIYVAPARKYVDLSKGWLRLVDAPDYDAARLPVDQFFRALARERKDAAIGVVLSGTGTDGTLGISAIKGEGGMIMVQAPETAQFAGMPRSAMATRQVDFSLPARLLPAKLHEYVRAPRFSSSGAEVPSDVRGILPKVFVLIRNRTGHDFTSYKSSTIARRVERRMNVHHVKDPRRYLRVLEQQPQEVDLLFSELLIGVTSFFRDPEAWQGVEEAFTQLIRSRPDGHVLRVWSVGCSTGEEAYSLAIVLKECLARERRTLALQIFGTDLDSESIDIARAGRYPSGIAADVNGQRLSRFFGEAPGGYRVGSEIRECAIFAPQNLLKDPPFTKLDLVVCRNLLIYFESEAQQRAMRIFHYALNPEGLLWLGPSEAASSYGDLFAAVQKKWRLFARKQGTVRSQPLMALPEDVGVTHLLQGGREEAPAKSFRIAATAERALLDLHVPPSVLTNASGEIAYIHGRTGSYLEPAAGEPRSNLFSMARDGLRLEISAALRQAAAHGSAVVQPGIRMHGSEGPSVRLTVTPLHEPSPLAGLFVVSFEPEKTAPARSKKRTVAEETQTARLEHELERTRQSLQGTIEELETSNEELKSMNEELQSTNEELQSANEELETSKEEMQSLNEELQTVNTELQSKMDALTRANDDMQNLLNSTDVATVFLDEKLRIKRFTEEAQGLVRMIPGDVGRSFADLANQLRYDGLMSDAQEVLRTLERRETEIQTRGGKWLLVRMLPYRTSDNVIDGLVITFIDIERQKRAEETSRAAQALAEAMVAAASEAQVVLDPELRIVVANRAFVALVGAPESAVVGSSFLDVGNRAFSAGELPRLLREVLPKDKNVVERGVRVAFPSAADQQKELYVSARRLPQAEGLPGRIFLSIRGFGPGGREDAGIEQPGREPSNREVR